MQGKRPKVKGSRRLADAGRTQPKSNSPTTMSYTVMELLFFFGGFLCIPRAHGPRAVPVSPIRRDGTLAPCSQSMVQRPETIPASPPTSILYHAICFKW